MITGYLKRFQRYTAVSGIVILWTSILIAMFKAHLGLISKRPISYLGVYQPTRWLFSTSLFISALLFIKFAYYVKRHFKIKNRFILYFLIGQICQIIVAFVPDQPHTHYKIIHTIAGFTLAFSLPFLIRSFTVSERRSKHRRMYLGLYKFQQVAFVLGIGAFVFTKGFAPLGEILPTVAFDVWMIVVTILA